MNALSPSAILHTQRLSNLADSRLSLPGNRDNADNAVDRKRESILIERAQRGDSEAFAELYNAYVAKIYRYVYYRVHLAPIAEDLPTDGFVRPIAGLPT